MRSSRDAMDATIERALGAEAAPDELRRLEAWLGESSENARHYARIARLLEAARALPPPAAAWRAPAAARLLAARWRPVTGSREAGTGPRESVPSGTEARDSEPRESVAHLPGRPGLGRAALWLPWSLAAAATLAFLVARGEPAAVVDLSKPTVVRTGPTELTTVELEDGSVVRLGPDSRLAFLRFADGREVTLAGLGYFDVAAHAGQPFRVRTASGDVEVLGTRFEVDARGGDLHLLVVEGRVALSASGRDVEVVSGEAGGIVRGRLLEPRRIAGADSVLRWTGTFLVFRSTPLRQAAEEIERAYDLQVEITDARIAERTVTATFIDQSAAAALDVLCTIAEVECEARPGSVTISPK